MNQFTVLAFNPDAKGPLSVFAGTLGTSGSDPNQLERPQSVSNETKSRILIADSGNNRIVSVKKWSFHNHRLALLDLQLAQEMENQPLMPLSPLSFLL